MQNHEKHEWNQDYLRTLDKLDKWHLEDEEQDVRGCMIVTRTGERIGRIEDMLVDRGQERVAAVRLQDGRVLPVEPLVIRGDDVLYAGELDGEHRGGSGKVVDEKRVPIVEEELVVGKRLVEHGGVRVRSRIVEQPASETVTLRDEDVSVERRPVDQRVDNADPLFKDREVAMVERDEEAVVAKEARVKEELIVRKEVDQRVEQISDTVRKTEVEVDQTR